MLVVRRVAAAALLLWLVLTLTFVLIRLAPGDAATFLVAPGASAADVARTRAELGLDRPMSVQYVRWLGATLSGDLGVSFASGHAVTQVLREAIPVSLLLG